MGELGSCAAIWQKCEDSYTWCQGIVGGRNMEVVLSGNTLSTVEIHVAASCILENSYNLPVIFLGIHLLHTYMCLSACMYVFYCLWKPEEGIGFHGTGITKVCELPYKPWNCTGSAGRVANAFNPWAISPGPTSTYQFLMDSKNTPNNISYHLVVFYCQ